ncbi:hypothetical protein AB0G42_23010 [Streptomyces yangpuensis]|uniref:hypothetical protein n=1 Tax=Streptomyces yangpuensis TaxID=1648182 RepID=UPI003440DD90
MNHLRIRRLPLLVKGPSSNILGGEEVEGRGRHLQAGAGVVPAILAAAGTEAVTGPHSDQTLCAWSDAANLVGVRHVHETDLAAARTTLALRDAASS